MTSADHGQVRGTKGTGGRVPATRAAPSGQVFPIKLMAEDGGEEAAEEVEARAVEEVGAIKKEDEVSLANMNLLDT
jgi:hypothetical protein